MPLFVIAMTAAFLFLAAVLLAWLANDGPYRLRVQLRKWRWDRESRALRRWDRKNRHRRWSWEDWRQRGRSDNG
jgi:hypothetical protein